MIANRIKAGLLKLLGQKNYLLLTSRIFFLAYKKGWLRKNPSYYTHYLMQDLIKAGDVIIDIGANLGYYTRLFAEKTGETGKVYAVEPIPLYREVLEQNIRQFNNILIFPYALGLEEDILKMGNSSSQKYRHGLMHVLSEGEDADEIHSVPVKNPEQLFNSLTHIDYIKCDIEGYEVPVIPAMRSLLEKHRPIIQVETDGENKRILMALFEQLNYVTVYAGRAHWEKYQHANEMLSGDLIAIPQEKWKP
jgi:FkbM family methyltransferase